MQKLCAMRGKQIWVSPEFDEWLSKLNDNFNSSLPEAKRLSKKDFSRLLPNFFTSPKVVLNLQVIENKRFRNKWNGGVISDLEEFKL